MKFGRIDTLTILHNNKRREGIYFLSPPINLNTGVDCPFLYSFEKCYLEQSARIFSCFYGYQSFFVTTFTLCFCYTMKIYMRRWKKG